MDLFAGKTVIVTGASSGIGKATAMAFSENSANVVAFARNENRLKTLTEQCSGTPGTILTIAGDVTKEQDRKRLVDATVETFGGIDVLVNAAGIIANGTIENTSESQWDEMFDINLRSVFRMMQLVLPYLVERKGNIINVSSVTGLRAFPNILAYCVSKAGVDQLTRCAALELASKGIRINAVNPGVVMTNLHKASGMNDEEYRNFVEHSKTTHPLGRVGTAKEVADLILFLASDKASWITGVSYSIDGGRAQTCLR
jgi:NAD(P)-dependent dehydrogenase (short-subunit alcohol dehydrogenase family)